MSSQTLGIIIGGLLPAIFFGISSIFAKASNSAGIGLGYYLIIISLAVFLTGIICHFALSDRTLSLASGRDAFLTGITWALGAGLLAVALTRFNSPISQLVPLYNMNTLVAVILGLWLFAEWQDLNVIKLLIGSVLVIIGGTLVAWA